MCVSKVCGDVFFFSLSLYFAAKLSAREIVQARMPIFGANAGTHHEAPELSLATFRWQTLPQI